MHKVQRQMLPWTEGGLYAIIVANIFTEVNAR